MAGGRRRAGARSRRELIEELRERLGHGAPRLHVLVILLLAGSVAFLVSFAALRGGLDAMALRYPLAALAGYAVFLLGIRLWIAWQRRRLELDVVDLGALPDGGSGTAGEGFEPGGGAMGGGGAGRGWEAEPGAPEPPAGGAPEGLVSGWADPAATPVAEGAGSALHADEVWLVVLVGALLLGGLVSLGYVVYAAPLLLGEVALDAALVTAVYRRLRRRDAQHWLHGVARRTWLAALLLVASVALAGLALDRAAPAASSIGEALAELRGR